MEYKCALTQNRGGSEEKRCAHVADTTEEQLPLSAFPRKNLSVTV